MSSTRRMRSPTRIARAPGGVALSDMQALFRQQQEFIREQTAQVLRKQDVLVKALQQVYDLQNQTSAAVQQSNRSKSVVDPGVTEALRQLQQTVQQTGASVRDLQAKSGADPGVTDALRQLQQTVMQSAQQTNEVRDLHDKTQADASKLMQEMRDKLMSAPQMEDFQNMSTDASTRSGSSETQVREVINGVETKNETSKNSWGTPGANVTTSRYSKSVKSVNGGPEEIVETYSGGRGKKPAAKKPVAKKATAKKPTAKKPSAKKA